MRKKILLSVGIVVCIGIATGIYLYQKPRTTAANQRTDYSLSATDLYKQFEANEAVANQKYEGKILEVTGTVADVQKSDSAISVLLTATNAMGGVNCSLLPVENAVVQQGETITVKGKCAGFLMDVTVLDAVVISGK